MVNSLSTGLQAYDLMERFKAVEAQAGITETSVNTPQENNNNVNNDYQQNNYDNNYTEPNYSSWSNDPYNSYNLNSMLNSAENAQNTENNDTAQGITDNNDNYSDIPNINDALQYQNLAIELEQESNNLMSDIASELIVANREYMGASSALTELLKKKDYEQSVIDAAKAAVDKALKRIEVTNEAMKAANESCDLAKKAKELTGEAVNAIKQNLSTAQDAFNEAKNILQGAIGELGEAETALEEAKKLTTEISKPETGTETTDATTTETNTDQYGVEIRAAKARDVEEAKEPARMTVEEAKAAGYTVITSISQLEKISENLDGKYILMNDIDLSGINWQPIGSEYTPFTGIFNGNGYEISGLNINSSVGIKDFDDVYDYGTILPESIAIQDRNMSKEHLQGENYGLFSVVNNAVIKNLNVTNANIQCNGNDKNVGIIAGQSKGTTFENINVSGNVTGYWYTGGVVGKVDDRDYLQYVDYKTGQVHVEVDNTVFSQVNANVNVSGTNYVGGLTGYILGTKYDPVIIKNCETHGSVNVDYDRGAVLAGQATCLNISGFKSDMSTNAKTFSNKNYEESELWSNGILNGVITQCSEVDARNIDYEGTINGKEFSGFNLSYMDDLPERLIAGAPKGSSEFDYAQIEDVSMIGQLLDNDDMLLKIYRCDSIEAVDAIFDKWLDKGWGGLGEPVILCNFDFLACLRDGNHKYSLSDYFEGPGEIICNRNEGEIADPSDLLDAHEGQWTEKTMSLGMSRYRSEDAMTGELAKLAQQYPQALGYKHGHTALSKTIQPFNLTEEDGTPYMQWGDSVVCKNESKTASDYKTIAQQELGENATDFERARKDIAVMREAGLSDREIVESLIAIGGGNDEFLDAMGLRYGNGRYGSDDVIKAFKDLGADWKEIQQYCYDFTDKVSKLADEYKAKLNANNNDNSSGYSDNSDSSSSYTDTSSLGGRAYQNRNTGRTSNNNSVQNTTATINTIGNQKVGKNNTTSDTENSKVSGNTSTKGSTQSANQSQGTNNNAGRNTNTNTSNTQQNNTPTQIISTNNNTNNNSAVRTTNNQAKPEINPYELQEKHNQFAEYIRNYAQQLRQKVLEDLKKYYSYDEKEDIPQLSKAEYKELVKKAAEKGGVEKLSKEEQAAMAAYQLNKNIQNIEDTAALDGVKTYQMTVNINGIERDLYTNVNGDQLVQKLDEKGNPLEDEYEYADGRGDYIGFNKTYPQIGYQVSDEDGNLLFKDDEGNNVKLIKDKEGNEKYITTDKDGKDIEYKGDKKKLSQMLTQYNLKDTVSELKKDMEKVSDDITNGKYPKEVSKEDTESETNTNVPEEDTTDKKEASKENSEPETDTSGTKESDKDNKKKEL